MTGAAHARLHWWRDSTRTPLWWIALTVVTAEVVAWNYFAITRDLFDAPFLIVSGMSTVAELSVGFYFWMTRPGSRLGCLIVAWMMAFYLVDQPVFLWPESRFAWTVQVLFRYLWLSIYAHMLLSFPDGRIRGRAAKLLVAWAYLGTFAFFVPSALLESPTYIVGYDGFGRGPHTYLFLGIAGITLPALWWNVFHVLIFARIIITDAFLYTRLRHATPAARRRLVPLYAILLTYWTAGAIYVLVYHFTDRAWGDAIFWWAALFPGVSAVATAWGLSRVHRARGHVADLVVELNEVEPGRVREALARTLGDPSLELGLWLPERRCWVDGEGQTLTLPDDASRGMTLVGDRLAVMIHDRDLLDQPRLLESVGSAARLALENERLHAELRAQLAELRESRARIVHAADEERRRLERDLHDGAQQRLLALGLGLRLLRTRQTDSESLAVLTDIEHELQEALSELRELASGIHPAILSDQGLGVAVQTLAERAQIPVEVHALDARFPAGVETAAYFCIAEALANITKYAHARQANVRLEGNDGLLRIRVEDDGIGGADPGNGTGLRGLADRVGALDGRLEVISPSGGGTVISVEIPCRPLARQAAHVFA